MIQPGTYCGDFTDTRTVLIGYIPIESRGYLVRAVNICLGSDYGPDEQSGWGIQVGRLQPAGAFTCLFEHGLGTGMRAAGTRWFANPAFRVAAGDLIALRAVAKGNPSTIHGLSVALEYGILGS